MDIKEIGINTRGLIRLRIGLLESSCECGFEHPDSTIHGVIQREKVKMGFHRDKKINVISTRMLSNCADIAVAEMLKIPREIIYFSFHLNWLIGSSEAI